MGRFMKGEVVVAPFPFSDLSQAKRRPALVVAELTGDDVLLCQITSKTVDDQYALPLEIADFASGGLRQPAQQHPSQSAFHRRGKDHSVPHGHFDH